VDAGAVRVCSSDTTCAQVPRTATDKFNADHIVNLLKLSHLGAS
jgi:hypothetical protein